MSEQIDETYETAKKAIRNKYLGNTALTVAIWAGLVIYMLSTQGEDGPNTTRAMMLAIGAYSSIIWAPLLMFFERRSYNREMKKLNENKDT
ncbi:MAG: hypothetical protein JKY99_08900 [Rhizobiales bacterium]|nr:hypothetical protein [Hyphomicrobiales bacterium]